MINLVFLFACFVLAFATGVMLKPIPAAAGKVPLLPLDRRVVFRVYIVVAVISCSLVAGLVAAYSANPEAFTWAVARPLDRMLTRYYWVMFAGVGLYASLRLCGVKHRHALWVLCLSLPGALTFPVTFIGALAVGVGGWDELVFEFIVHPATWALPFIAVRQWIILRERGDIRPVFGLALTLLIVAIYLLNTPLRLPNLY